MEGEVPEEGEEKDEEPYTVEEEQDDGRTRDEVLSLKSYPESVASKVTSIAASRAPSTHISARSSVLISRLEQKLDKEKHERVKMQREMERIRKMNEELLHKIKDK